MIKNKKGIIFGIANDHSIAWGIAKNLHKNGAKLSITYQNETLLKRVKPLADQVECELLVECDFSKQNSIENTINKVSNTWGNIYFVIHAAAYSEKNELNGRYIDTSKDNFIKSLNISCYSFTNLAKLSEPILNEGGSLLTLSFYGSKKVMPNYNVMGVAKAALESSVRYLAVDLGGRGIRINALSAGMMRTLAGSAVKNARSMFKFAEKHKPLKDIPLNLDDIGSSGLYLISDLSRGVSGEIHYVDQGYNIIVIPKTEDL